MRDLELKILERHHSKQLTTCPKQLPQGNAQHLEFRRISKMCWLTLERVNRAQSAAVLNEIYRFIC